MAQTPMWELAVQGNDLYADQLGNTYVIQKDQVAKYNPDGSLFRINGSKQLAQIAHLDVTNPMKLLLFYQEFSRIVFWDNTLTQNGNPIYLEEYNLEQATAACTSYDNGFWVFNQTDFRLVRFNQSLRITSDIPNIHLITGKRVLVNFMVENEDRLYLNAPQTGILVFDIFGTYIKTIPIIGLRDFQCIDKRIFYQDAISGQLRCYETQSLRDDAINLSIPVGGRLRVSSKHIVHMDQTYIRAYPLQ